MLNVIKQDSESNLKPTYYIENITLNIFILDLKVVGNSAVQRF